MARKRSKPIQGVEVIVQEGGATKSSARPKGKAPASKRGRKKHTTFRGKLKDKILHGHAISKIAAQYEKTGGPGSDYVGIGGRMARTLGFNTSKGPEGANSGTTGGSAVGVQMADDMNYRSAHHVYMPGDGTKIVSGMSLVGDVIPTDTSFAVADIIDASTEFTGLPVTPQNDKLFSAAVAECENYLMFDVQSIVVHLQSIRPTTDGGAVYAKYYPDSNVAFLSGGATGRVVSEGTLNLNGAPGPVVGPPTSLGWSTQSNVDLGMATEQQVMTSEDAVQGRMYEDTHLAIDPRAGAYGGFSFNEQRPMTTAIDVRDDTGEISNQLSFVAVGDWRANCQGAIQLYTDGIPAELIGTTTHKLYVSYVIVVKDFQYQANLYTQIPWFNAVEAIKEQLPLALREQVTEHHDKELVWQIFLAARASVCRHHRVEYQIPEDHPAVTHYKATKVREAEEALAEQKQRDNIEVRYDQLVAAGDIAIEPTKMPKPQDPYIAVEDFLRRYDHIAELLTEDTVDAAVLCQARRWLRDSKDMYNIAARTQEKDAIHLALRDHVTDLTELVDEASANVILTEKSMKPPEAAAPKGAAARTASAIYPFRTSL